MNRLASSLACLTLTGILVSGCTVVISPPERAENDFSISTSVEDVEALRIRWVTGDITVVIDEAATEITATGTRVVKAGTEEEAEDALADFDIVFETTDTDIKRKTLRFEAPDVDGFVLFMADVEVVLPPGFDLDIDSTAGAVSVAGNVGTTGIDLDTGDVSVTDQDGNTSVEVGAGAVTVSSESGDVAVEVGSGTVTVSASPDATGSLSAQTGAGSVDIFVPTTTKASLRLTGSLGSVSVELDDFEVTELTVSNTQIEAVLNGGGAEIVGRTGVGSVEFGPQTE